MNWFLWAFLLIIQNASFTLVSRARNSGSYSYHAVAAVFSNGVWFASNLILVDNILKIIKSSSTQMAVLTGLFYTVCTVVGSISMHVCAKTYLEKGKRAVGA